MTKLLIMNQIHQLEMEILSLPTPLKTQLQPKLKGYKSEVDKLKKNVVRNETLD